MTEQHKLSTKTLLNRKKYSSELKEKLPNCFTLDMKHAMEREKIVFFRNKRHSGSLVKHYFSVESRAMFEVCLHTIMHLSNTYSSLVLDRCHHSEIPRNKGRVPASYKCVI